MIQAAINQPNANIKIIYNPLRVGGPYENLALITNTLGNPITDATVSLNNTKFAYIKPIVNINISPGEPCNS